MNIRINYKRGTQIVLANFLLVCLLLNIAGPVYAQVQSLSGTWDFRFDSIQQFTPIQLPGSCEEQGYGYKTTVKDPHRLTREVRYVGKAWYKKIIEVPVAWKSKRVELFLERCLWETALWLDGKPIGLQNTLSAPHEYDLGVLAPGTHTLEIRIDNTIKLPIGDWGFSITDDGQGNWNGIIGQIELRATDPIWLKQVQVFENHLKVDVGNVTGKMHHVKIQDSFFSIPSGGAVIGLPFKPTPLTWDEFTPLVKTLNVKLTSAIYHDEKTVQYGNRRLTTKNGQIIINGRPTLMRGVNNECIYPKTGYPPMDKNSWLHLFNVCKSYGMNFMRFNAWCPPKAAFEAADELGYFLQVEIPFWGSFGEDPEREKFLSEELERILATYGNHPSFAFMGMGNESPGSLDVLVRKGKTIDTRMLYRCQNGDTITNGDFAERGTEIGQRGVKGPLTDWDRWSLIKTPEVDRYKKLSLPTIAHEVGQWSSYPDFDQLPKFTGNLRPYNYENFRESLIKQGMIGQNKMFASATGKFAVSLYKDEIEGCLRTFPHGGFSIVDARDFTGEGAAIIGWLDAFWDSKGLITPEEFRRFCGPTVCLLRMPKRIYNNDETFLAQAELSHYGLNNIKSETKWKIEDEGNGIIASGIFKAREIVTGRVNQLGQISAALKEINEAKRLVVTVSCAGTSNSWNIWVYPSRQNNFSTQVRIAHAFDDDTKAALNRGGRVLLFSSPEEGLYEIKNSFMGPDEVRQFPPVEKGKSAIPGSYMPAFWNMRLFNQIGTLSILCDPRHPALASFPTEEQSDWQWADLLGRYTAQTSYFIAGDQASHEWNDRFNRSKSIVLNEAPHDYKPIVQMIDNYERNYKLGLIFETRVGKGKLIICALDLTTDIESRPAARQLKSSLLMYIDSKEFNPTHELPMELLEKIVGQ
jgi:hypothetical protein